jgi:uncharacterized membrane protein
MNNKVMFLKPGSGHFFKTELEFWLAISVVFSVGLVIAGSIFTGSLILGFLVWNLFLAFIPYSISKWVQRNIAWKGSRLKFCFAFIIWLLFIPNSFYIMTDLFHLGSFDTIPGWYELAVILSFAWNGLLLGTLSVRQMERLIDESASKRMRIFFIYPVMFLSALGVYIGRYMRFNSWDVVTDPLSLFKDISDLAMHPIQYRYAWGMIFCFSIFMTLIFFTLMRGHELNTSKGNTN